MVPGKILGITQGRKKA